MATRYRIACFCLWITAMFLFANEGVHAQVIDDNFLKAIQNALASVTGGVLGQPGNPNFPINANAAIAAPGGVLANLQGSSFGNLIQAMINLANQVLSQAGTTALTVLNTMTSGVFKDSCGPTGFRFGPFINKLTSGFLGGDDTVGVNTYSLSDILKSVGTTLSPSLSNLLGTLPGGLGGIINTAQGFLANLLNQGLRPGINTQAGPATSVTGVNLGAGIDPNSIPGGAARTGSVADLINAFSGIFRNLPGGGPGANGVPGAGTGNAAGGTGFPVTGGFAGQGGIPGISPGTGVVGTGTNPGAGVVGTPNGGLFGGFLGGLFGK